MTVDKTFTHCLSQVTPMTADDLLLKNPSEAPSRQARKFTVPSPALPVEYDHGDEGLLHQYRALAATFYYNQWGLRSLLPNGPDETVIAHQGRQCIAGGRLTVSSPREPRQLPCERDGFGLQHALPELDLYNVVYGEISDFIALAEFQNGDVTAVVFHSLIRAAVKRRAQYVFSASTLPQTGPCHHAARILDVPYEIRRDLALPDYEELAGGRAFLTLFDLTGWNSA
jgi:hypothetical protein